MDYIKLDDCIHGGLYKLDARNVHYGIFCYSDNSFIGIRRKFADEFLDKELHYDADTKYGTAKPIKFIENSGFRELYDVSDEKQYNDIFNYLQEIH